MSIRGKGSKQSSFLLAISVFVLGLSGCEFKIEKNGRTLASGGFALRESPLSQAAGQLLTSRCISCHQSIVSPISADTLVRSGWVSPGDPDGSLLIHRVEGMGGVMPPSAPLAASEITLLRNWIATEFVASAPTPGASPTSPAGSLSAPEILRRSCASCHGAGSAGSGGINYIEDVPRLISSGWILPGDPNGSVLFREVSNGTMPTAGPLPSSEIEVLRSWIETGLGAYQIPLSATYRSIQANVITPKCVSCHGQSVARGGIRLDGYDRVMRFVRSGLPSESKLYKVILEGEMPPRDSPAVGANEQEVLRSWILAGAANN